MNIKAPLVFVALLLSLCEISGQAGNDVRSAGNDVLPMAVERLPDLNTPRAGCSIVLGPDGNPVVFGGHTTGFIRTATAEYFADGAWHEVGMLYPHDNAFCVPLRSGEVLVGGGSSEDFGIGQSWGVEAYDPVAHTFRAMPILDRKRAMANAVELEDGTVVVSGNWYGDDDIGACPPGGVFDTVGEVSVARGAYPFILPTGPSDALILGGIDANGKRIWTSCVDRFRGGPLEVPLLAEWSPVCSYEDGDDCAIGEYSYLLLAESEDGRYAPILVRGEEFSLLPLAANIPVQAGGARIEYWSKVFANRSSQTAWVFGVVEGDRRIALLRLGYGEALDGGKVSVALYLSEPLEGTEWSGCAQLMPDGSILLVGGIYADNYAPTAAVYRLLPEGGEPWPTAKKSRLPWLLGLLCGILTGCAAIFVGWWIRRRKPRHPQTLASESQEPDLMARITALMEERQLYKRKGLTLSDLAAELATNKTYVSALLNNLSGEKFTSLLTRYRVEYAQRLMREHPDMLLDDIADESGFSSRTTFFRSFKALTGMTPQEWKKIR